MHIIYTSDAKKFPPCVDSSRCLHQGVLPVEGFVISTNFDVPKHAGDLLKSDEHI